MAALNDVAQSTATRNGVFDAACGLFELAEHAAHLRAVLLHALHQLQQVRTGGERRLGLPHDERAEMRFGFIHCAQDAIQHFVADRMHLALEAQDGDVVAGVPHAHFIGLEYGLAVLTDFAEQTDRE